MLTVEVFQREGGSHFNKTSKWLFFMDITKSCRDVGELKDVARQACNLFLAECKKRGIPIFITETYRPQERQNWLYEQGRSRPGSIVTWTKSSNHTGRMAWDIAVSPPHALYDYGIIAKAGAVASSLGIEWGGNWPPNNRDTPHFQVSTGWKPPKNMGEGFVVEKTKVDINGAIREVATINEGGNNYIKLRDLVNPKLKVDYDPVNKIPKIIIK